MAVRRKLARNLLTNSLLKTHQPSNTSEIVSTLETRRAYSDCITHRKYTCCCHSGLEKHGKTAKRRKGLQQHGDGQGSVVGGLAQPGSRAPPAPLPAGAVPPARPLSSRGMDPTPPPLVAVAVPAGAEHLGAGARPPRFATSTSTSLTGNTIRELCGIVNMNCFDLT